jgi:hypothetical protein
LRGWLSDEDGEVRFFKLDAAYGGTILFATLWGVVLKEWKGTGRGTKVLGAVGFLLLVASTVVVGYGNYLKGR